jgi:acyl-coenzyme A synthetase/AMP-(fatty) acid ligase
VKPCAVVGKPNSVAGEIPKAFMVLKDQKTATEEEIKEFVNSKVAPYKAV